MEANGKDDLRTPLLQALDSPAISSKKDEKISTAVLRVRNIHCASCATSIESALQNLNGVQSVMVSPLQGQAVVKYILEVINVSRA